MADRHVQNVREITLDILFEIFEKGSYSHIVLNTALSEYGYLDKRDRSFISRSVHGTLEYVIQIDYILDLYSTTHVIDMKPFIRTLLRMSVYQLLYMDRVPDRAVCDEAVKLARSHGFNGLSGFVNGILRTISRNKKDLIFNDDPVKYSMPGWIIDMWHETYDIDTIHKMLTYFLEDEPLTVRFDTSRTDSEAIINSLSGQGVETVLCPYLDGIYYLHGIDHVEALDAFKDGYIEIQDLSSSLAGPAVSPKSGDIVLDVCGAPGGKGIHIAEMLGGTGHVEVRDIDPDKIRMTMENISRSHLKNISASVWDATVTDSSYIEKADIVIADLPCSGLGVIGRKPDIKLRIKPEDLEQLASLQRDILSVVWQYVKPKGELIYSTCTIDRLENEDNISWFLDNFPFESVDIEGRLGDKLRSETMKQGFIQLLPGIMPCDGFFISVFRRKDG